jgi:hypothetical protein
VCRDAARGRCTRQFCKFEHADALDLAPSALDGGPMQCSGSVAAPATAPGATCRDFTKGRCAREQCKFAHAKPGAAQTQAASVPPVGSSLVRPAQHSPEPHDGSRSSRLSSSSSSSSSSSPAPSSAPTSPCRPPRRVPSDDSLPSSADNSPHPARSRSRSWSALEMPNPESPRGFWQKLPTVLGKKRPFAQASSPPASTSLPAAREPQQQHAAPSEGADRRAL